MYVFQTYPKTTTKIWKMNSDIASIKDYSPKTINFHKCGGKIITEERVIFFVFDPFKPSFNIFIENEKMCFLSNSILHESGEFFFFKCDTLPSEIHISNKCAKLRANNYCFKLNIEIKAKSLPFLCKSF